MKKSALNKILNNKKITHCYIRKGAYYRPNSCGYTDYRSKAGIYLKEDAVRHAEKCDELWLEPVNIQEHNAEIMTEIKDLLSRYI